MEMSMKFIYKEKWAHKRKKVNAQGVVKEYLT